MSTSKKKPVRKPAPRAPVVTVGKGPPWGATKAQAAENARVAQIRNIVAEMLAPLARDVAAATAEVHELGVNLGMVPNTASLTTGDIVYFPGTSAGDANHGAWVVRSNGPNGVMIEHTSTCRRQEVPSGALVRRTMSLRAEPAPDPAAAVTGFVVGDIVRFKDSGDVDALSGGWRVVGIAPDGLCSIARPDFPQTSLRNANPDALALVATFAAADANRDFVARVDRAETEARRLSFTLAVRDSELAAAETHMKDLKSHLTARDRQVTALLKTLGDRERPVLSLSLDELAREHRAASINEGRITSCSCGVEFSATPEVDTAALYARHLVVAGAARSMDLARATPGAGRNGPDA